MPKLSIPRGTKPRALLALASLLDGFAMGDLPADLMNPKPGASISPRTAIRYAARCLGKSRDDVAAMTSGDMRALFASEALKAAVDRNAWREVGEVEVEVEGEDEAPVAPVTPAPVAPVAPATSGGLDALLGGIIAAQVTAQVEAALASRPAVDPAEVARIAREAVHVVRVEVARPGEAPRVVEGLHHARFPRLLELLSAGLHVYLYGPAGTGKSSAAKNAASALGLSFGSTGKVDSKYDLVGFRDAHGRVVRTAFREVWEHGGLFLLDEMDRSDPSAVLALNNGLATGLLDFPDATIAKHPSTVIVAGGNTRLSGGDRNYTGAVAQDASVADRFAFLSWGYDERLERALAGEDMLDWVLFVQGVRKAAARLRIDVLATPRASISGAALLRRGDRREDVEDEVLWKGLDAAMVAKIRAEVG
jgi:cobaltochelatase CobS